MTSLSELKELRTKFKDWPEIVALCDHAAKLERAREQMADTIVIMFRERIEALERANEWQDKLNREVINLFKDLHEILEKIDK